MARGGMARWGMARGAESVSMMGGHEPELNRLNGQLEVVIAEQQRQIREQAAFNSVNSFFLSYVPPLLTNAFSSRARQPDFGW